MCSKIEDSIRIKGARVHNLKNIDADIPHENLVVITGLSGSGKSTLAFDTIFAEGQRRYVESLSAYARQFLGRIDKPDVDSIEGIAPAIAIEQKVNTRNPRSTVGTTTEIYDYLKLLFARIGKTYSPVTGKEVKVYHVVDVVDYIMSRPDGSRLIITAPVRLREGQGIIEKLTLLAREGLQRIRLRGKTTLIEEAIPTLDNKTASESIEVVIDRTRVDSTAGEELRGRLGDSVEKAFNYGGGKCRIICETGGIETAEEFS
ncbi:MAG: excinuclease ABC subunit A, partial [Rikenellaceae bacterium]|nr:excinuclease ABC subunit A [Rikenellaceae bacterium]